MLHVRNLVVRYPGAHGQLSAAVSGLTLRIEAGEAVGLMGESGCGKSTLAKAVMGLLPRAAHRASGSIEWRGEEILAAPERRLRQIRGSGIALIAQDPALSLHPMLRVRSQVGEAIRAHRPADARANRHEALAALAETGLTDATFAKAYPHQLSAGQRQRVVVAQALACRPALMIADEPVSALDNLAQHELLQLLRTVRTRHALALLFITQDPLALPGLVDRVAVMYAGQIVETGSPAQVLSRPRHPYTSALLRSIPPLPAATPREYPRPRLQALPAPVAALPEDGCRFAPGCPECQPRCRKGQPAAVLFDDASTVRCFERGSGLA